MSIKLADHPYFTRSKGPADSFPRQSSDKGKTVMGDFNEEVSLTDVVVAQPTIADQNEFILQLMQQIAEMKVEMQRRQETPPPGFGPNIADGRPPIYFPSSKYGSNSESSIYTYSESFYYRPDNLKSPLCFRILPNSTSSSKQPPPNATPSSKYSNCLQSPNTSSPFKLEHQSSGLPIDLPNRPKRSKSLCSSTPTKDSHFPSSRPCRARCARF